MPTMQVYSPLGATEIARSHASRLDSLDGKTTAFLSNDKWQAHRVLALAQEVLQGHYPQARILPFREFPQGNIQIDRSCAVATPLGGWPHPETSAPLPFLPGIPSQRGFRPDRTARLLAGHSALPMRTMLVSQRVSVRRVPVSVATRPIWQ